ncbi:MAG TPA: MarR family transcriptional regulator [Acidimicrobiales bacterium]|nr:MarR family transcriptional regulator [Acidimicrobiales bacterium]
MEATTTAGSEAATALPSQLRLAVLRLSRRLRQEAVGQTTPSQLSALTSVAKHGELSLGELAAIERVAPPSMTRIAGRLEEQGLVARRTDSADRRVAKIAVTDAGLDLLTETRNRRDAFLAVRMAELSDDEREAIAAAVPVLERLARND